MKIPRSLTRLVVATASSATTAGVALEHSVAGAVLSATQPLWAAALDDLAWRGIQVVSDVAIMDSRLSPEELIGRLASSDDGLRLLARTMEVAATAAHTEKLRALGRCLSAGSSDAAKIDVELLLVAAVAALEQQHMRLLRLLATPHERGAAPGVVVNGAWTVNEPVNEDPSLTPSVVETLVGPLVAHGVVTAGSGFGMLVYSPSWLGRLLLERAREADVGAESYGQPNGG
jgi:hypothetical protein